MKKKLPKQSAEKKLLKKFFSKKHFEVNFFYKKYITKQFHKNFSKKLKKKILDILILIFKKLRKTIVQKKSVKCRLIHRFQKGNLSVKMLVKLG